MFINPLRIFHEQQENDIVLNIWIQQTAILSEKGREMKQKQIVNKKWCS